MDTRIVPAQEPTLFPAASEAAAAVLGDGFPVALPSETVYGLAADAVCPEALARVFEAKARPFFDPLILHIATPDWLDRVVQIPDEQADLVENLTSAFWPGPLTLVLPRAPSVPDLACSGLPTVAVRCPAHPLFHAVLMRFGGPLAAPSANRFGRISPTTAAHVVEELGGRIPLVLDGGPCPHGIESTIVRPSGDALELLRPGPVSREALAQFATVHDAPGADDASAPSSPGRLASHYAPQTPLRFLSENEAPLPVAGLRCGLLAWDAAGDGFAVVERLSDRLDPVEAAARLFSALRGLDTAGLDLILAQRVPMDGVGCAINDRLMRASATSRISHG